MNTKLLKIILDVMFIVLLNLDFSPSLKSEIREKQDEYKELTKYT